MAECCPDVRLTMTMPSAGSPDKVADWPLPSVLAPPVTPAFAKEPRQRRSGAAYRVGVVDRDVDEALARSFLAELARPSATAARAGSTSRGRPGKTGPRRRRARAPGVRSYVCERHVGTGDAGSRHRHPRGIAGNPGSQRSVLSGGTHLRRRRALLHGLRQPGRSSSAT
jgi:hypothetical protein